MRIAMYTKFTLYLFVFVPAFSLAFGAPFNTFLNLKIRLQPRIDFGKIYSYKDRGDLYIRRARLEISKRWSDLPAGSLDLKIVLKADKVEMDYDYKTGKRYSYSSKVRLHHAYMNWKISNQISIRIGRYKKPYSRVSLTSSSRQLFIERPYSTEDAKKWLGDYDSNQILFYGKIFRGIFRYMLSVSDGSTIEDKQKAGDNVRSDVKLGNFYAVRVEFSPPGFIEKKKDDTGIGEKNKVSVVSLGLNYAQNRNFDVDTDNNTGNGYEVQNEKGTVWGVDVFGRFLIGPGALTAQAEYVNMKYDRLDIKEKGFYVQGGYLIPIPIGKIEPAVRYENFKEEKNGEEKKKKSIITLGFNHYLKAHKIKWAYNVLLINNKESGAKDQTVHQIQAQFYF